MGIYRGAGGTGDAVNDASSEATLVQTLVGNATTQANNAATSATAAQAAAAQANISKGLAEDSATAADVSEANASTSASNAATSETNAATSATNAANSATTATTQATNASNSASAASTSATNASNSASAASTSATNAATSATNSANSATSSATSATASATARDAALAALDSFDDRYLGAKTTDPTVDNDGNALATGALYFNTGSNVMKVYDGSAWLAAYVSLSGALIAANNLSDLSSASAARTNLGLGTAATVADNTLVHLAGTETITGAKTFSTAPVVAGLSNSVNLTFTGTGNRITGDFSNTTVANRVAFQTSTTDGNSILYVIPNGTATTGQWVVTNSSDLSTTSTGNFTFIQSNATDGRIGATRLSASGAFVPLTFYTSNSERLRIDISGNVGIGNTSPSAKLDVTGNLAITGTGSRITGDFSNATAANRVLFQSSTTNGNTNFGLIPNGTGVNSNFVAVNNSDPTNASTLNLGIFGSTDTRINSTITGTGTYLPLTMYTGGSERLRIDTSGNVGIGTSSPSVKADINGVMRATTWSLNGNGIVGGTTAFSAGTVSTDANWGMYFRTPTGSGGIAEYAWVNAAGTERMRIDSSGNLLMATTGEIQFFASTYGIRASTGLEIKTGDFTRFLKGSTEYMRIDSSGNVGIGTSSPFSAAGWKALSIDGTSQSLLDLKIGGVSTGYVYASGVGVHIVNNTATTPLMFQTNSSERMRIDSSGNVGIGASSTSAFFNGTSQAAKVFISYSSANITVDQPTPTLALHNPNTTTNNYSSIYFSTINTSSTLVGTSAILGIHGSRDTAWGSGALAFLTTASGSDGPTESMRITSAGGISFGSSGTAYGTAGQTLVSNGDAAPTWGSSIVSGTAVTATGGTITFSGIPSWVKRVTVMLYRVSTTGANYQIGIRVGSTTLQTTGYQTKYIALDNVGGLASGNVTTYAVLQPISAAATETLSGTAVFTNVTGNLWTYTFSVGNNNEVVANGAGSVTTSAVLDRIGIVPTSGTFDTGTINILYE